MCTHLLHVLTLVHCQTLLYGHSPLPGYAHDIDLAGQVMQPEMMILMMDGTRIRAPD